MAQAPTAIEYLRPPELVRTSHWEDANEVRVANWIRPWDGEERIDVGITAVPIARAAIKPVSAHLGPNALRDVRPFFTTYSIDYGVELRDLVVRDTGDVDIPLWDVVAAHERIYRAARGLFAHEPRFFPVFVGGDHSLTRPIVRALSEARPDLERLGVLQFDAHIDAQTLDDAGPHNGTPIRGILEDENGVEGANVVQIGISGFVNAAHYRDYLVEEQGGTIFSARDVAPEASHYDVSMAAGEHALLPRVRAQPPDALVVADGFSCKTQIEQAGTGRRALHLAEVIELAAEHGGPRGDHPERRATNGNGRRPA